MSIFTPMLDFPKFTTVECRLKEHLINAAYPDDFTHFLGTEKQLFATALKISLNDAVLNSFNPPNCEAFPQLLPRNYLVACIENEADNECNRETDVHAVYSIRGVKHLIQKVSKDKIQWKVLEIPSDLHNKLIRQIDIKNRVVYGFDSPIEKNVDARYQQMYFEGQITYYRRNKLECHCNLL
ncbi:MAG: hypothetical protein H0X29_10870 [Parachlamydiaceae bacterium]|nr:hypothetical protein [Parachlamydiaceae bacterium]